MDELSLFASMAILRDVFQPSAPTKSYELFRGRRKQLEALLSTFAEVGQHAVVYGDRGVGKTSLANVGSALYSEESVSQTLVIRVQCVDGDSFETVWAGFCAELDLAVLALPADTREALSPQVESVRSLLLHTSDQYLGATLVSNALRMLAQQCRVAVIIDEFDRLGGVAGSTGFSDLIKSLSDSSANVTLVIVGVADDVTGLIASHLSVERNLHQISMPVMTDPEIMEIVTGGFAAFSERSGVQLDVDPSAARAVASIAKGFPYYAHLLASASGIDALRSDSDVVTQKTVYMAMVRAVESVSQLIRQKYVDATLARADSNIELTLLASAMCAPDALGYFSSTEVASELSMITGIAKRASHVNAHLARLSDEPAWILEMRRFSARRVRYRFRDPLMRPFVLMKGYEDGRLGGGN